MRSLAVYVVVVFLATATVEAAIAISSGAGLLVAFYSAIVGFAWFGWTLALAGLVPFSIFMVVLPWALHRSPLRSRVLTGAVTSATIWGATALGVAAISAAVRGSDWVGAPISIGAAVILGAFLGGADVWVRNRRPPGMVK